MSDQNETTDQADEQPDIMSDLRVDDPTVRVDDPRERIAGPVLSSRQREG